MEYQLVKLEKSDRIATVTINRPDKLNALNRQVIAELNAAWTELANDDEVGAVILTGSGEKSFIAGADISELTELTTNQQGRELTQGGIELTQAMENFPKPIIGAVNGFALGGGLEVALACHIRLASSNAKLGLPEVTLGVIPGYGGTQRLPRLVGKGRALELILTGGMIDAEEAHRMGLVNKVTEPGELLDTAKKMAGKILGNGPVAVHLALEAVQRGMEMPIEQGLHLEGDLFGMVCVTEDSKEGTKAFLEKRKADFKGV